MVLKLWLAHHADRILFRPTRTSMRRLYLRSGEGAWRLSASWQLHPEIQGEQEKPWQFGEGFGRFRIWPNNWNFETWMKAILNKDTYHLCRSEWIVRLGVQNAWKTFYKLKMIEKCKNADETCISSWRKICWIYMTKSSYGTSSGHPASSRDASSESTSKRLCCGISWWSNQLVTSTLKLKFWEKPEL